jgi:hypothetical protein
MTPTEMLGQDWRLIPMSARMFNALSRIVEIRTVSDIYTRGWSALLRERAVGVKSLRGLESSLLQYGLPPLRHRCPQCGRYDA